MAIMIQTLVNTVPSRLLPLVHDDFNSSAMAVEHDFLVSPLTKEQVPTEYHSPS